MAKPKLPEPEHTASGIKVTVGNRESPYWILFSPDNWTLLDRTTFMSTTPLGRLRMIVERAVDWNIPNSKWEPIPFDREGLLSQIDAVEKGSPSSNEFLASAITVSTLYVRDPNGEEMADAVSLLRDLALQANQAKGEGLRMPAQLNGPLQIAFWQGLQAVENLPFLAKS